MKLLVCFYKNMTSKNYVYVVYQWEIAPKEIEDAKIIGVFNNFANARKSLKNSAKKYSENTCLEYISERNKKLILCSDDKNCDENDYDSQFTYFAIKKMNIMD